MINSPIFKKITREKALEELKTTYLFAFLGFLFLIVLLILLRLFGIFNSYTIVEYLITSVILLFVLPGVVSIWGLVGYIIREYHSIRVNSQLFHSEGWRFLIDEYFFIDHKVYLEGLFNGYTLRFQYNYGTEVDILWERIHQNNKELHETRGIRLMILLKGNDEQRMILSQQNNLSCYFFGYYHQNEAFYVGVRILEDIDLISRPLLEQEIDALLAIPEEYGLTALAIDDFNKLPVKVQTSLLRV